MRERDQTRYSAARADFMKYRKPALPVLGALCLIATVSVGSAASQSTGAEDRIKAFENGILPLPQGPAEPNAPAPKPQSLVERMAFYKVPGVSLAVIRDGRIEWSKGYGEIVAGSGKAVTPDTLFEAASTTKALVAAVILHYVDQGLLDLDADVNAYLKSWKVPENEFTKKEKVTLRRLLTHQAGLPTTNMGYDEKAGVPTLVQVVKGEAPAQNKAAIPVIVPGSKWQYSNVGYVLIQLVLEDALGRKLESILEDAVYRPLGLKSTTLAYPLPAAWREKEAMPHDGDGKAASPSMHPTAQAQGGLMTTPSDLALFLIELMDANDGASRKLFSQKAAQAMFRPAVELDPRLFGFPLSDGLGLFIKGQGPGLAILHPGNNFPGSICWLIGFPGRREGAIFMLNGANGEALAFEILMALSRVYEWPSLM